jgi:hypothetical protein
MGACPRSDRSELIYRGDRDRLPQDCITAIRPADFLALLEPRR